MMFRTSVAAVWLVVVCLAANAHVVVDTEPAVIHSPVKYPASAVASREEGTVQVVTEVDASGRTVGAKLAKSSGYPDLDAAALQSIPGWSFSPATKDGKPIAQRIVVPIRFQLEYEPADTSASPQALLAVASVLLGILGSLIWVVGFVWSIILAKRTSILWLSGMVALWIVTYPLFVALHWSIARRNLLVVALGISLFTLGQYLS